MIYFLDLFGVFVFAVSGSLAAGRKGLDLFGVLVLALATALGGGTLRDLILGAHPVFWIDDPLYIYVATGAAILSIIIAKLPPATSTLLQTADALGLAVFTIIGTERALSYHAPGAIAVIMGMMTGVAGGMIRDILAGEIPLVLRREIYATASVGGAVAYLLLKKVIAPPLATSLTIVLILAVRMTAIRWQLSLPVFHPEEEL